MDNTWIFGYGSLIWRPDFEFIEQRQVRLLGWQRRFWQGSHDHRGTPQAPGRVVTLAPAEGATCDGIAYRIADATAQQVFNNLDYREKNGYQQLDTSVLCQDQSRLNVVTYLAAADNMAYLGPAAASEIARQIAQCHGPSGSNSDYLFDLANALRQLGSLDEHVFELEALVRQLNIKTKVGG